MREQIADLDLFERHVQDLIEALPQPCEDGWTAIFDLQPILERFTMDTATEFLFGESVHSQKGDDTDTSSLFTKREMKQFVEAFFAAQKTTATSIFLMDLYFLLHNRKFKAQCKIVHDFVDTYVHRRLSSDKKPESSKYIVLDAIMADFKDPKDLRSQLLNILLAGSDTISGTLGFLFATLAQHPHIFTTLRKQIINDFGTFDNPKIITLAGLKNCSYLQWTLNEVLRVYPAVPVNFREAVRDTTLPTGGGPDGTAPVFIPKGHLVLWELWTMHSDPDLWASSSTDPNPSTNDANDEEENMSPTKFNPLRWRNRKFGFNYLPFNAGPRICIGQQFALAEVAYVAVRVLQYFDGMDGSALPALEGQGADVRLPCDWKLVDKVAGGVKVRLRRTS
jgi:cytochrome P450